MNCSVDAKRCPLAAVPGVTREGVRRVDGLTAFARAEAHVPALSAGARLGRGTLIFSGYLCGDALSIDPRC